MLEHVVVDLVGVVEVDLGSQQIVEDTVDKEGIH